VGIQSVRDFQAACSWVYFNKAHRNVHAMSLRAC
jgi:hypothetical protein